MTAQLVASELANLIQESKRKNNDLRQVSISAPPLHKEHLLTKMDRPLKSLWRSSRV